MPLTNIQFENLKPNTPGAKLLFLHLGVQHKLTDIDKYLSIHKFVNTVGYHIVPRVDGFPNPFNISTWEKVKWISKGHRLTKLSFSEITDLRALEIAQLASQVDLPIAVSYSGGIDSAVIVAAMIRNFGKELLDRVVIKMNNASYFENPYFFDNVIQKHNLRLSDKLEYDWENSIVIAGEPGDSVTLPFVLPVMDALHPGIYQKSPVAEPEILLNWLAEYDNMENAIWYYEQILASAKAENINIETYEDFFWWGKQALAYGGNVLNLLKQRANPWTDRSWSKFNSCAIAWFHTSLYRAWSATHRNNGEKYNGTMRSFKMPMKQYIYSVDRNQYYLDYKTKTFSSAFPERGKIAALYDDGTAYFYPSTFLRS